MQDSDARVKLSIEWRRSKVLELQSQGYSQAEISRTLRVSEPTISRDIAALRLLANAEIKNHIANLPEEYSKAIAGLNLIIRKAFTLAEQAPSIRDRNASLVVAKDTIALKFDLQTDSEVINTALDLIESKPLDGIAAENPTALKNIAEDNSDSINNIANSSSKIIEEQPTKLHEAGEAGQLIGQKEEQPTNDIYRKINCEDTEPEDSTVQRAEAEIDREIEAIDRRMDKTQSDDSSSITDHIPVKIKRFVVDNQDTEPIDLTTSMSQAQQNEINEQDSRIYKGLTDNMRGNTYNPNRNRLDLR